MPLRVRTDFGVKNHRVWQYMLEKRQNTNALMIGSSVHNQRVERLHRDVNIQVVNKFHNEFTSLEENGLLNPDSEADLFCLHLIYMPLINNRLNEFKSAHNLHSLSSENQLSPSQLFQMDYRLFHLQNLDPTGALDVDDIVQGSNNNLSVPPIAAMPPSFLQNVRAIIVRKRSCDEFDIYCARARFIRSQAFVF